MPRRTPAPSPLVSALRSGALVLGSFFLGALMPCGSPLSAARVAEAHVVKLKDGKVLEGEVIREDPKEVEIETTFDGRKTLARSEILYVDKSALPLRKQLEAKAKEASDAHARWDLYKWAKKQGFKKQLEFILEGIIDVKPGDKRARKLLGHVRVDGKWYTAEEFKRLEQEKFEAQQRAKGLVPYKGEWVTPEEKEGREKGLKKDGDDWVTEEEWHNRRGESLVGGKWVKIGFEEGKELAAKASRESRVNLGYRWSPHFDAITEVKPEVTERVLGAAEKAFSVMRSLLKPTHEDYPEDLDGRVQLALLNKLPAYVRFSQWFDKTFDVESLQPGWARAIQRQHGWWQLQERRVVCVYQFPNTDKTFTSNVVHNAGLLLLTCYKRNYQFPSVWLRQGFAYYLELQAYGYSQSFTIGRGGGSGGAAEGTAGPVWLDTEKWRGALAKLVAEGQDPPLRRIARMTMDQFRYVELVKSWSVVECLVSLNRAKFKQFIDFSKERGKKEEEALGQAFGMNYRKLDEVWRSYVTAGFKHAK